MASFSATSSDFEEIPDDEPVSTQHHSYARVGSSSTSGGVDRTFESTAFSQEVEGNGNNLTTPTTTQPHGSYFEENTSFVPASPSGDDLGFSGSASHHETFAGTSDGLAENLNDEDDDLPSSSAQNIIPPQLQRGWGMLCSWAVTTAHLAKEKAVEISNSETARELRVKTSEAVESVGPVWQRTVEAAQPYWERTKVGVAEAAELAREGSVAASEALAPTISMVSEQLSEVATEGWKKLSETTAEWAGPPREGTEDSSSPLSSSTGFSSSSSSSAQPSSATMVV